MMTSVTFVHDEETRKWVTRVAGVKDALEARQAFAAVVLTIQMLDPALLGHTKVHQTIDTDQFEITPAVM